MIHRLGRPLLEVDLKEIENVKVNQSFLDRICKTGKLVITLRGQDKPVILSRLANPYAFWKQLKIAVFHVRKG